MLGAAKFLRKEIFVRRRYSRGGFELRPDDVVVDVGANMGMFVAWAVPQVPRGRIIAIEPTDVIQCLQRNAAEQNWTNVTALRTAVGRDGEQLELREYPGFNIITHQVGLRPARITRLLVNTLFFRYRQKPVDVTVPCQSLGRILDEHNVTRVNFLKVDCEGAEYAMFDSLTPDHWQRIERIAMEFHEYHPDQRHGKLVAQLEQQGFCVTVRKPWFDYYCLKFGEIWAWRETPRPRSSR